MKIVTCIYSNLTDSEYGGSQKNKFIFYYSLKSILKINADFVCYTSPEEIDELKEFFKDHHNISFKNYPLNSSPYHSQIVKIKNIIPFDKYRCYELMLTKMLWMEEECNNINDDDYVFWIDAGLSYRNLIAKKYFKYPDFQKDFEYDLYDCNIFTKNFFNNISNSITKGYLFFSINADQHSFDQYNGFIKEFPIIKIIGGIFGGKSLNHKKLSIQYKQLCTDILNLNLLPKEEIVLSIIISNDRDNYNFINFDGWYHEDYKAPFNISPNPFCEVLKNFS